MRRRAASGYRIGAARAAAAGRGNFRLGRHGKYGDALLPDLYTFRAAPRGHPVAIHAFFQYVAISEPALAFVSRALPVAFIDLSAALFDDAGQFVALFRSQ